MKIQTSTLLILALLAAFLSEGRGKLVIQRASVTMQFITFTSVREFD